MKARLLKAVRERYEIRKYTRSSIYEDECSEANPMYVVYDTYLNHRAFTPYRSYDVALDDLIRVIRNDYSSCRKRNRNKYTKLWYK